ncbi:MAG: hypothetical protein IJ740_11325 [Ruminococcus sp.]|nr:hypothetical protein [Ruminococcus sp.]
MKSNRKKTENSIIKLLIDIHSLTGIEFLPSIFSLFSFGLSFVTLFKTDKGEFKFLLVMFCIFMVINSICFIFHGYHIHKYKTSIDNHKKKSLGYLDYHRESFKNVNYVQNNKDKLISLLYENSEGKFKSASDFYDKYLKNYFAKFSGLTDDEINSYKNNDKTFSDFYSIYYLHVNEATEALIKNIKDTYNRFITNTFSNIKK